MNIMFKAQKQTETLKRNFFLSFFMKHYLILIMFLSLIGIIVNEKLDGSIYTSVVFLIILCVCLLIKFYQNFDPFEKMDAYWRNK